jgi:hypothetical protein
MHKQRHNAVARDVFSSPGIIVKNDSRWFIKAAAAKESNSGAAACRRFFCPSRAAAIAPAINRSGVIGLKFDVLHRHTTPGYTANPYNR